MSKNLVSPDSTSQFTHDVEPKAITRKQLAGRLGVHLETIKRWERLGRLEPIYFGPRTIRYPHAYVVKLEEEGLSS